MILCYNRAMKRCLATIAAILLSAVLSAAAVDYNAIDSPLQSAAYSGRFYDIFSNPAALPLMEVQPGMIAVRTNIRDSFTPSDFGYGFSGVQDQMWTVDATFISKYISLTAYYGLEYDRLYRENPIYDVYSSLKVELNAAYAVPYFSFGIRISGGNQMVRRDKDINNFGDYITNGWFTPFERDTGSEFFNLGLGAILDVSPFSLGVYIGKILTLSNGQLYIGGDAIAESTTISAALEGPRYTSRGDLMLVRPRASFSLTGLVEAFTRSIEFECDITFQFLPDADLTIGVSYLERQHEWVTFNPENATVNFMMRGGAKGFYGIIGVSFKATDFTSFAPMIGFSWIS